LSFLWKLVRDEISLMSDGTAFQACGLAIQNCHVPQFSSRSHGSCHQFLIYCTSWYRLVMCVMIIFMHEKVENT